MQTEGRKSPGETGREAQTPAEISESPRHAVGEIERHQQARAALAELEKAVIKQQAKVEEGRKVLAAISRTKGIIYKGKDIQLSDPQGEQAQLNEINPEVGQLNSLLESQDEQLIIYAAGMDIPNNPIKELYPQLLEAKRGLELMQTSGLGGKHPSLIEQNSRIGAIKSQLDAGLLDIKKTMKDRLDTIHQEERERIMRDSMKYVEAKREWETENQLLESMNQKIAVEKELIKAGEK